MGGCSFGGLGCSSWRVCVSVSGVLFSVGVCVCVWPVDLFTPFSTLHRASRSRCWRRWTFNFKKNILTCDLPTFLCTPSSWWLVYHTPLFTPSSLFTGRQGRGARGGGGGQGGARARPGRDVHGHLHGPVEGLLHAWRRLQRFARRLRHHQVDRRHKHTHTICI